MRRGVVSAPKMKLKSKFRGYGMIATSNETSNIASKLPFMIAGKRFQDTVLNGDRQSVSPSSSFDLGSRMSFQHKKMPLVVQSDSRPKTPVIVVGYPDGYPRGLHLVGNRARSPGIVTLPAKANNTKLKKLAGKDETEDSSDAGRTTSDEKMRPSVTNMTKTMRQTSSNHSSLTKHRSKDSPEDGKKPKVDKKRKTNAIVAPWREFGVFQTPAERRKQTFQNFKLMSPDPPKTPTQTPSRQTAKTVVMKLHRDRPIHTLQQRDSMETNSSISMYSRKWSSRNLTFRNVTADVLAQNSNSKLKGRIPSAEKSATRLTYFRAPRDFPPLKAKNDSSTVPNSRIKNKYNGVPSALAPKKSLTAVTVANTAVPNQGTMFSLQPIGNQPGALTYNNRLKNIVQSNSIPIPPSKRLEQARLMNHIIHGYTGVNPITSPSYNAGHRFNNSTGNPNLNQSSYPAAVVAPKAKPIKPQHFPPLPIPGSKRENIYIGQYDGSDDSDNEGDPPKKLSNV